MNGTYAGEDECMGWREVWETAGIRRMNMMPFIVSACLPSAPYKCEWGSHKTSIHEANDVDCLVIV